MKRTEKALYTKLDKESYKLLKKYSGDFYEILTKINIPINRYRFRVRRDGYEKLRSATFGKILAFGSSKNPDFENVQRFEISRHSKALPELDKLLFEFGKKITGKKFTSCCVNDSYPMSRHKDGNNVGTSFIVGLGTYKGGELRIYKKGKNDGYEDVDIRSGVYFNGFENYHEVLPFTGRRYSIIYYNC